MKKVFYILVISLILLLPYKVSALSGSLSLECDSFTKKVGENISCTLYGITDAGVSAVESTLVYDGVILNNETVSSIWQGNYQSKSLLLYTDTNKTSKFELMSFNVTSVTAGEYSLTFNDTYFSDATFVRNQVLNPNYTFTFITEEAAEEANSQTDINIVPTNNNSGSSSSNNTKVDEENPGTGAFLSISLIVVLSLIGVIVYIKARHKHIYKI